MWLLLYLSCRERRSRLTRNWRATWLELCQNCMETIKRCLLSFPLKLHGRTTRSSRKNSMSCQLQNYRVLRRSHRRRPERLLQPEHRPIYQHRRCPNHLAKLDRHLLPKQFLPCHQYLMKRVTQCSWKSMHSWKHAGKEFWSSRRSRRSKRHYEHD